MSATIKCWECDGTGTYGQTFHRGLNIKIDCYRCNATGQVPTEMLQWVEKGKEIRTRRQAEKKTLREYGLLYGLTAAGMSDLETGRIDNTEFQPL